jgi:LytTr DNA-binding domain
MHKGDCAVASGDFVNAGHVEARRGWLPLRNLLIVAAVGAVLGRIGPFDTFSELSAPARYAYWIGLTLLLWLQTAIAMHLLRDAAARWSWPVRTVAAALIGALPTAFEVAWAENLLRVSRDLGLVDVAMIYGDVALIAVALALPLELIDGHRLVGTPHSGPSAPPAVEVGDIDDLISALPPERRGTLLALEAEDHYLRVHTDRGNALIHKRFSDALGRVAAIDGLRVHRSWWVARAAIEHVARDGDRLALHLRGGLVVPVSRTYALAVRDAGLVPA